MRGKVLAVKGDQVTVRTEDGLLREVHAGQVKRTAMLSKENREKVRNAIMYLNHSFAEMEDIVFPDALIDPQAPGDGPAINAFKRGLFDLINLGDEILEGYTEQFG